MSRFTLVLIHSNLTLMRIEGFSSKDAAWSEGLRLHNAWIVKDFYIVEVK